MSLIGGGLSAWGEDDMPDWYRKAAKSQGRFNTQLTDYARGQIGKGVTPYGGQITAGTNPLYEQMFSYFMPQPGPGGMPGQPGPPGQQPGFGSVIDRTLSMQPGEANMGRVEDYWNKAFYDPAMQRMQQDILPAIRESYAGMGGFDSGGRNRAEGKAWADMMGNLEATRAGLLQDEFWKQEGLVDRALQFAPQAFGVMGGVAEQKRGLEQAPLTDEYSKWMMSQPWNNPWLSMGGRGQYSAGRDGGNPYATNFGNALGQMGGTMLGSWMSDWLNRGRRNQTQPQGYTQGSMDPYSVYR